MRTLCFLTLALLVGSAEAAEQPFLFEALAGRTPYHASWDKLMKSVQPTPDWLVQFNKNFDGLAGQLTPVTVGGKPYELSFVCKPNDCDSHKFVVLFDAGGTRALGALGGKDNSPAFFGSPSQDEEQALTKAVK